MTSQAPRLPASNEFTPGALGGGEALFDALGIVAENGAKDRTLETFRQRWRSDSARARSDKDSQRAMQRKLANNVLLGMKALGLVREQGPDALLLTDLGSRIIGLAASGEREAAYRDFASHLLRTAHGLELLHVAGDVRRRDGQVSLTALRKELLARGFDIPTNSKNPSAIRQWLELSGVVDSKWNVDQDLLRELTQVDSRTIAEWRALSDEQRELLIALRIRAEGNRTPLQAHDALSLLSQRGVAYQEAQAKKTLWQPLVEGRWITQDVKAGGRGAKGGIISLTEKTLTLDMEFVSGLALGDIPAELQDQLNRPLDEILVDLDSDDTYVKGIALELLSLRLAADSGLLADRFRERSARTGGGEVDLVAEGAHVHFSRWLFQCKNQTAKVRLDVLAKEIGMATLLKAQVVVIVTTTTFSRTVIEYARNAAEFTAIQVILLDRDDLRAYKQRGMSALRERLHQQALNTRRLKREQLDELPADADD